MFELFLAAIEELEIASRGGDWGYAALAELFGNSELAKMIVNKLAGEK